MKHKYKINIDQPLPSEDKINAHKDFGRILADYHNLTEPIYNRPLYKNPKAFIGLVFILTVAFLVFWAVDQEEKDKKKEAELQELPAEIRLAAENSFLKPPLPALQVPATNVDFDGSKPQQLKLADGIILNIPANSFGTADGQQIPGMVHLKVRKIDSMAEIIGMGLPMQMYGGVIHSDGIIEISASAGHLEAPLVLTADKLISVEFPVSEDASSSSLFRMNVEDASWDQVNGTIAAVSRMQNAASLNPEDGFGVVEYDADGKIIPKTKPSTDGQGPEIKVMKFSMDRLGLFCLGNPISSVERSAVSYKVRFTDPQDQSLRLLTLYAIDKSAKTVKFLWPKSADFRFDLDIAPGRPFDYIGFLSDGRLAMAQNVVATRDTQQVHVLQMKLSDSPIKNLQELTQLIDPLAGL